MRRIPEREAAARVTEGGESFKDLGDGTKPCLDAGRGARKPDRGDAPDGTNDGCAVNFHLVIKIVLWTS